jgi:hypothetical protein
MNDRRYDAMRHAVALALSGRFHNWWAVSARLRASRYRETDVDWTTGQRGWIDQLCNEARLVFQTQDWATPSSPRSLLAVIDGGGRTCVVEPRRHGQATCAQVRQLNHRPR